MWFRLARMTAAADVNVLLLGGTAEARVLAKALVERGIAVTSSLAGRVSQPRLPVGEVRIGGFRGVDGLATAIAEGGFTHLIDATHPFAVGMRANAVAAARQAEVPVVRLARPGWRQHPSSESWTWVNSFDEALTAMQGLGSRPFITSGRQTLEHYLSWDEAEALVRIVEPLDFEVPARWTVVRDRGPFSVTDEVALMREHGVDVLVTKDSGGSYTAAKLDAAAQLGVPVVVVSRPANPDGMPELADVSDVMGWLGV